MSRQLGFGQQQSQQLPQTAWQHDVWQHEVWQQVSQQQSFLWKRARSLSRQLGLGQQSQQVGWQQVWQQVGWQQVVWQHGVQQSQQLFLWKRARSLSRQLGFEQQSQQTSQQLPQVEQPPQHDAAGAAGAAGAAAGAGSAPASHAVVTSRNAAFTSYPPFGTDLALGHGRQGVNARDRLTGPRLSKFLGLLRNQHPSPPPGRALVRCVLLFSIGLPPALP